VGEFSANAPDNPNLTVITIPMRPFSPFTDSPAKVEKRPSGPYAATFEEKKLLDRLERKADGRRKARGAKTDARNEAATDSRERCWSPSARCGSLCS